jgi:hypothetical protein
MKKINGFAAACLLIVPLPLTAQESEPVVSLETETEVPMQTEWMELVKGYRDESTGAEVRDVGEGDESGTRRIVVSIPKSALEDTDAIEEVVVVGQRPEEFQMPAFVQGMKEGFENIEYEWLDDYDNDNYGLVIKLSADSKVPIRLFMYSDTGYMR